MASCEGPPQISLAGWSVRCYARRPWLHQRTGCCSLFLVCASEPPRLSGKPLDENGKPGDRASTHFPF